MDMERYTILSKETTALYLPGSPVMILAQALLKDNANDHVLAQIKYKSLSDKPICALKVSVGTCDVAEKPTPSVDGFQYLDLTVDLGDDFGSKTLIPLPDKSSRGFKAAVIEVVFVDKTVWTAAPDAVWEPLPKQELLIGRLKNIELADEYVIKTCPQAQFVPMRCGDIWLCTCGSVNTSRREKCGACGQRYNDLIRALDAGELEASYKERKAREAELAERKQAEAAVRKKKTKKLVSVVIAAAILCTAAALVVTKIVMPSMTYSKAEELYNSGEYAAAQKAFEELGDYKDSGLRVEECKEKIIENKYNEAIGNMRDGNYSAAIELLTEVGDYKDAVQMRYKAELNICKVGDSFQFGEYEQDKNGDFKSPIEWKILKKEKGRILMISKYALDVKPYNTTAANVTWEDCSLRKWLNGTFLESAFSQDEQDMIKLTSNESSQDKVFLLSRTEAQTYFKTDEERQVRNTKYAVEKCDDKYYAKCCFWWLRSQTDESSWSGNAADIVDGSGSLVEYKSVAPCMRRVDATNTSVRPAIWVDIGQQKNP